MLTKLQMGRVLGAAAMMIGCATAGPAFALDPQPDYGRYTETTFLPYLNAAGAQMQRPPSLGLSFGGGRVHRAILDSGSTGVVVGATSIPDFERLAKIADGQLTYTSSGRIMVGQWVRTPLTIHGAGGARIETEVMPVLAVTQVRCMPRARNCTPHEDVRHIGMIGIGFARQHDRQPQSTPDKNPFMRIAGGDGGGERRRGYILTPQGVHVGLTAANTRGAFRYIKLDAQEDRSDWAAVPACISIDRTTPLSCGTMLVDTGVADMFMTVSPAQAGAARGSLPPGTQVTILAGSGGGLAELYSFRAGDASPVAPRRIHLRVSPDRTFVNTSLHLLNAFDFLYDADGGYAGFRRR
jgi:hypothetical protein